MNDLHDAIWRASNRADAAGGQLEVATNLLERDGRIYVRNTTDPSTVLAFTRTEWDAFIGAVQDGEFDV